MPDLKPIEHAGGRFGPRLAVEQHALDDAYLVIARGEIDLGTAALLRGALQDAGDAGEPRVVVDLQGVDFMDSTALHLLLNALRRLSRQGRELEVVCGDGPVRRLFRSTRLEETFNLRPSREVALAG